MTYITINCNEQVSYTYCIQSLEDSFHSVMGISWTNHLQVYSIRTQHELHDRTKLFMVRYKPLTSHSWNQPNWELSGQFCLPLSLFELELAIGTPSSKSKELTKYFPSDMLIYIEFRGKSDTKQTSKKKIWLNLGLVIWYMDSMGYCMLLMPLYVMEILKTFLACLK